MMDHGVTEAAMESTAVYWVPAWNELCESMELKLVNPYFIKQLPGRKSDVKDARSIAECLLKNLIKGSFVPGPIVQDMRKLNRRIMDLNGEMTYKEMRIQTRQLRLLHQEQKLPVRTGGDNRGADGRVPGSADLALQGTFPQTIRTSSNRPRSQGTRCHGNHCGDRGRHEDVRHGGMPCGMVRPETSQQHQQRTL